MGQVLMYQGMEEFYVPLLRKGLPLWSSGQISWLQIQMRSSRSGTGSTQPREYN
jgi:hypothetical protein